MAGFVGKQVLERQFREPDRLAALFLYSPITAPSYAQTTDLW